MKFSACEKSWNKSMMLKTEMYMFVYVYTSPCSSTPVGVCVCEYIYKYSYVFCVCISMLGVSGPLHLCMCFIHSQQPYKLGLSFFYCSKNINC